MQYRERWEEIENIGEGGQGKVIRVLDKQKVVQLDLHAFTQAIQRSQQPINSKIMEDWEKIRKGIAEIVRAEKRYIQKLWMSKRKSVSFSISKHQNPSHEGERTRSCKNIPH